MVLTLSLFGLLLFQHNHESDIAVNTFPAGTAVEFGNFNFSVPDNTLMIAEEDVHRMVDLTGATFIPNCVGLLVSQNGNLDFVVVIQHFPFKSYSLQPEVDLEVLNDFFKRRHLYRQTETSPDNASIIDEPRLNQEQGTFSVAMSYVEDEGKPFYYKKQIWVSNKDTLILTLKASEEGWLANEEIRESIFQSVIRREYGDEMAAATERESYLNLFGVNLSLSNQSEGLSPVVYLTSGILVVFAIALLAFAIRLMRKQAAEQPDEETTESG